MASYIIKKQLENGEFTKVGEIYKADMEEDVSSPDPEVVAEHVTDAIKTQMRVDGNPTLHFHVQDPSDNIFGLEIVPDEMFKLKNWVQEGKHDVYFFNKHEAPAAKQPEGQS